MNPPHESRPHRVSVYCPDRHIQYDGTTPDRSGVGGGVTARIRLARALARLGLHVTVICNCRRAHRTAGVTYQPLDGVNELVADVVVFNSSAGVPDLRPAHDLQVRAGLRLVRVDGVPKPIGLDEFRFDYLYTPSNFVRSVVLKEWGVPPEKLAVFHHGVESAHHRPQRMWGRDSRNPYRLVYAGHPDKGLPAALGILRILRERDSRFELHVFGGDGLYGKRDQNPPPEPGLVFHGTVGQPLLAKRLQENAFCLNLQARPEPFGLVLAEAMAAGCIPLVSPVGAFPEIVQNGLNGFIITGEYGDPSTWQRAASVVVALAGNPELAAYVREHAQRTPRTWDVVALSWVGHWAWARGQPVAENVKRQSGWIPPCPVCHGGQIALADGYHCVACGRYAPDLPGLV